MVSKQATALRSVLIQRQSHCCLLTMSDIIIEKQSICLRLMGTTLTRWCCLSSLAGGSLLRNHLLGFSFQIIPFSTFAKQECYCLSLPLYFRNLFFIAAFRCKDSVLALWMSCRILCQSPVPDVKQMHHPHNTMIIILL